MTDRPAMPQPGAGPAADNGLQRERTTLAWRRTGLALIVAALVIGRLSAQETGPAAVVPIVFGVVVVAVALVWTLREGPRDGSGGVSAFDSVLTDGRLPASLSLLAVLLCLVELSTIA